MEGGEACTEEEARMVRPRNFQAPVEDDEDQSEEGDEECAEAEAKQEEKETKVFPCRILPRTKDSLLSALTTLEEVVCQFKFDPLHKDMSAYSEALLVANTFLSGSDIDVVKVATRLRNDDGLKGRTIDNFKYIKYVLERGNIDLSTKTPTFRTLYGPQGFYDPVERFTSSVYLERIKELREAFQLPPSCEEEEEVPHQLAPSIENLINAVQTVEDIVCKGHDRVTGTAEAELLCAVFFPGRTALRTDDVALKLTADLPRKYDISLKLKVIKGMIEAGQFDLTTRPPTMVNPARGHALADSSWLYKRSLTQLRNVLVMPQFSYEGELLPEAAESNEDYEIAGDTPNLTLNLDLLNTPPSAFPSTIEYLQFKLFTAKKYMEIQMGYAEIARSMGIPVQETRAQYEALLAELNTTAENIFNRPKPDEVATRTLAGNQVALLESSTSNIVKNTKQIQVVKTPHSATTSNVKNTKQFQVVKTPHSATTSNVKNTKQFQVVKTPHSATTSNVKNTKQFQVVKTPHSATTSNVKTPKKMTAITQQDIVLPKCERGLFHRSDEKQLADVLAMFSSDERRTTRRSVREEEAETPKKAQEEKAGSAQQNVRPVSSLFKTPKKAQEEKPGSAQQNVRPLSAKFKMPKKMTATEDQDIILPKCERGLFHRSDQKQLADVLAMFSSEGKRTTRQRVREEEAEAQAEDDELAPPPPKKMKDAESKTTAAPEDIMTKAAPQMKEKTTTEAEPKKNATNATTKTPMKKQDEGAESKKNAATSMKKEHKLMKKEDGQKKEAPKKKEIVQLIEEQDEEAEEPQPGPSIPAKEDNSAPTDQEDEGVLLMKPVRGLADDNDEFVDADCWRIICNGLKRGGRK